MSGDVGDTLVIGVIGCDNEHHILICFATVGRCRLTLSSLRLLLLFLVGISCGGNSQKLAERDTIFASCPWSLPGLTHATWSCKIAQTKTKPLNYKNKQETVLNRVCQSEIGYYPYMHSWPTALMHLHTLAQPH